MAVHSSVGKSYFFVLALVVFVPSEGEYANESLFTIIVVQFVSLQQLLTLLVRCTHQSMLSIVLVLYTSDLTDPVPTVWKYMGHTTVHITPIVMVHHLDWLILNLDQSSTIAVTIMFGIM